MYNEMTGVNYYLEYTLHQINHVILQCEQKLYTTEIYT